MKKGPDGFFYGPINPYQKEHQLIDELLLEQGLGDKNSEYSVYKLDLKKPRCKSLQELSKPELTQLILALLQRNSDLRMQAEKSVGVMSSEGIYLSAGLLGYCLARKPELTEELIVAMAEYLIKVPEFYSWSGPVQPLVDRIEAFCKEHNPNPELQKILTNLLTKLVRMEAKRGGQGMRKMINVIERIVSGTNTQLPMAASDPWAIRALSTLNTLPRTELSAWSELLTLCQSQSGSAPKTSFLKNASKLHAQVGASSFKTHMLAWLSDAQKPREVRVPGRYGHDGTLPPLQPDPINAAILRGLIWICAREEDRELARAIGELAQLSFKKIPGYGPRSILLGNACIWTLGNMPGREGMGTLVILKIKCKYNQAQNSVAKALEATAQRLNVPVEEIEEMGVPSYGMEEIGLRTEELGEYTAHLKIVDAHTTQLTFVDKKGIVLEKPPAEHKETCKEELAELKAAKKEVEKMLPAQRDRLDRLFREKKEWPFEAWKERYLDHPLMGYFARRLIWRVTENGKTQDITFLKDALVNVEGKKVQPAKNARVVLWHPMLSKEPEVLAWRNFLETHEIRQPFKQAHREIYVLTDAERRTNTYSNRFAAHLVRQHQFHALCGARGWKSILYIPHADNGFHSPYAHLPGWNLQTEFWVEGIEGHATDTGEEDFALGRSGVAALLSTDQVRFSETDAQGRAHTEPLALERVPPVIFSELMRDVDLFVGVASVGNDPAWVDAAQRAPAERTYWQNYSFGELSQTAKTRRDVLERLLPRLKIASHCTLEERFLKVRGELRTYKIHLGSGNIMMEPNDQYLCIVPKQSSDAANKIYLPFEGDNTLAVILSKAFMLADDKKIKDKSILSQINRK